MPYQKITKVAIYIDYDNFKITHNQLHKMESIPGSFWDSFNQKLITYYQNNFIANTYEICDHIGSWICIGISDYPTDSERGKKEKFQTLDRKKGYIVKYGNRNVHYDSSGKKSLGQEKGVDTEIVCQMMMGAFQNHYDSCILVSDDADYIPAVKRIQNFFGKKVIQAGYRNGKLREHAYAHIPFENGDKDLNFPGSTS